MTDPISPILSKNKPALSSIDRYRQSAEEASKIIAERDREEQAKTFDKNVQSYQIANQSSNSGAEDRASLGLKR